MISRAWSVALSGRPGPVIVALPETMLTAMTAARPCTLYQSPNRLPADDGDQLASLLATASRPVILLGGTRWQDEAARQVETFACAADIPVVAAFRFHDIIDNHSPCYVGDAGVGMLAYMKQLLTDADLITAPSMSSSTEMTTAGYSLFDVPRMAARLIHSHASDAELGKIYTADLPLHADPTRWRHCWPGLRLPASAARKWATPRAPTILAALLPAATRRYRHAADHGASAGGASR